MKILHVDDELATLEITRQFLKKENSDFDVDSATSVKEAFTKLDGGTYDLVLSDYMMPDITGLEFLRLLREHSDIPFILFTGKGREEVAMQALNLGANRYVQKSSDIKTQYHLLADVIVQEINHYRLEQERMIAIQDLRESEQRFRIAIENLAHGVFIHDLDGKLTMVNKAACQNTGYSRKELLGMSVSDIDPESITRDDRRKVWEELQQGHSKKIYSVHRRKDGTCYHAEIHISAMTLKGRPMMLGVAQDITERKNVEEERKHYIEELQLLNRTILAASRMEDIDEICDLVGETVQKVNEGSFVTVSVYDRADELITIRTIAGDETKIQKGICLLGDLSRIGASPQEMLRRYRGTHQGKLIHVPEGFAGVVPESVPHEKCRTVEEEFGITDVYRCGFSLDDIPYGSVTILLTKNKDLKFKSAIETMVSHFSEIIHHRQAELALVASQEKYRSLYNSIRDAILVADTERRIIDCNAAFTELFGYELEEIIGMPTGHVYKSKEQFEEMGRKLIEHRDDPNFFYTIDYLKKDGSIFTGETNVFYLHKESGEVTGFIGLIRDITEKKKIEQRRNLLYTLLRHDIRNKAQIAYLSLESLIETGLSGAQQDIVDHAKMTILSKIELIERVSMLHKIENEPVDEIKLKPIIEEILKEYEVRAKRRGIRFETSFSDEEIVVQAGNLATALLTNIVANALKHSNGTIVRLSTKVMSDETILYIEDDGKGIDKEVIDAVFDDEYEERADQFSGLGLYLARKIAEGYGGKIRISSSELGGARVEVHFCS